MKLNKYLNEGMSIYISREIKYKVQDNLKCCFTCQYCKIDKNDLSMLYYCSSNDVQTNVPVSPIGICKYYKG